MALNPKKKSLIVIIPCGEIDLPLGPQRGYIWGKDE